MLPEVNNENTTLFNEQLQYIRENKESMFAFIKGIKIGFELNLTFYFSAVVAYELRKKYSSIAEGILTERFMVNEFGQPNRTTKEESMLDSVIVKKNEDYSLKESMKAEVVMSVLADYARRMGTGKIYPSQFKKQEKVIWNTIKRAQAQIDKYFREGNVRYREIADIIDIYEVHVRDYGRQIDLHFGRFGFSMTNDASAKDLLAYVYKEREDVKEKRKFVKEKLVELKKKEENLLREMGITSMFSSPEDSGLDELYRNTYEEVRLKTSQNLTFSDYTILSETKEQLLERINSATENLRSVITFLGEPHAEKVRLPEETRIDAEKKCLTIHYYMFHYDDRAVKEFLEEYNSYIGVRDMLEEIEQSIQEREVLASVVFEKKLVTIKCVIRTKQAGAAEENAYRHPQLKTVSQVLHCKGGILYRPTGEQVLTSDVIMFELLEKIRNIDKAHLESVEKAKEMLLSVLSEREEELLRDKDMTLLTGEKNYYMLLNKRTYNNVIKIPKGSVFTKDIKALCIHPADPNVPMYDGFASIALAVKSGDEDYVLENSNEFEVDSNLKKKIMSVFTGYMSQQTITV